MRFSMGVQLWQPTPARLDARARELENLGFSSLSVPDHVVPGSVAALTACATLAHATQRARVGPLVLNNDFRHAGVLAHESFALSELSGARFELGLGAGYARREYAKVRLPFAPGPDRMRRLDESLSTIRRIFTDADESDSTSPAAGEHRQPRIPIVIGGNSLPLMQIAVRHADILNLPGYSPKVHGTGIRPDLFSTAATERRIAQLAAYERERATPLELHVLAQWFSITNTRRREAERIAPLFGCEPETLLDSPYVLLGTHREILSHLVELADRLGVTRWTVFGDRPGLDIFDLGPIVESIG